MKGTTNRRKIIVMLAAMLVLASAQLFAGNAASDTTLSAFGLNTASSNLFALLTGLIPGGIIAIKFIWDIVQSYMNKDQEPTKLQKSIIRLGITVAVLVLYTVVINVLLPKASTDDTGAVNKDLVSGILGGAEVGLQYLGL